jgi:hypothetical protein
LDTRLHEYLAKQEQQFGDLVAIYVGEHAAAQQSYWGVIKAVLMTSLLCSVIGFGGYASPWGNDGAMILGTISVIAFAATGLMSLVSSSNSVSSEQVEAAGLVVSPGGLAMIQGDLAGELRWEEIRSAKLSKGAVALGRNKQFRGECIQVVVDGATILIADIYHEPLSQIYANIQRLRSV